MAKILKRFCKTYTHHFGIHKDQQRGEKQRRGEKELGKTAALFAAHSMLSGCNREITNKVDLRSEKGR